METIETRRVLSYPLTEDAVTRFEGRPSQMKADDGEVRVVLADNHPVFLHGLSALLRKISGFKIIEIKLDGVSALQSIRRFEPAIAILGISMSGIGGIEVLKQVEKQGLATRIVLLTAFASDQELVAAVTNGAWGIVPKELAADAVTDCVTKVAAGERWLPRELVDPAMSREAQRRNENKKIEAVLTSREFEISGLVAEGLSNKHIARRVGICEGTVKIHLCNAYRKLGGMNRASLSSIVNRYHGGQPLTA
jgi:DNA-binding NarL/FixJ family response regulator